jgi:replicative DNA helicase
MMMNNTLPIRSISKVANEAIAYIKARKDHTAVSLKTRWKKFNNCCMGGIEPNTIYTISGISGSGKSSFANLMTSDIIDLNPTEEVIVLAFSLEMVGFRQVGRMLSNKLNLTTSTLYSSKKDLDDTTLGKVINVTNSLRQYPIYFVDNPGTPEQVKNTILSFYNANVKDTNKHFVIFYDHTLLTSKIGTVLDTMSELEQVFIQIKKMPNTSIVQLSQLNRDIEKPERINNPTSHYPMRSDLSSSDAMFQASDYVFIIHRPELLHITEYGPSRLPTRNKIYLHLIKNRDAGEPCILEFDNDLAHNNFIETERDDK